MFVNVYKNSCVSFVGCYSAYMEQKMAENKIVRVGVGCWVFNPSGQLLLGKRLSEHGNGTWAPPGGHLEYGETPLHCAVRELEEETGIKVSQTKFVSMGFTNDIFGYGKHYVTLHYFMPRIYTRPRIMEPNKCAEWQWFDVNKLPENLFLSARNLLNQVNLQNFLTL